MNTTITPITDLAAATPVEVDTELAALDGRHFQLLALLASTINYLHSLDSQRASYIGRSSRKVWPKDDGDTVDSVRAKVANDAPWHDRDAAVRYLARYAETIEAARTNRERAAVLDEEYDRRPWRRYIAVLGGHIHSGYWCAGGTIRITTIRQWAPLLSGKPVADAVAELGPTLCTHCFPDAPVQWQAGEKKTEYCPGSRQAEVPGTYRRQGMGGWGRCRECGTNQTVTGRGLIRAHKPAKSAS